MSAGRNPESPASPEELRGPGSDAVRPALTAIVFAIAAAFSYWNPIAAPFGLVVGLAAAVLSVRVLRRAGRRLLAGAALAVSILAVLWSGLVMARTAGVGREPAGAIVSGASSSQASQVLDQQAERTRASRARAREELGKVGGEPAAPGGEGGQGGRAPSAPPAGKGR